MNGGDSAKWMYASHPLTIGGKAKSSVECALHTTQKKVGGAHPTIIARPGCSDDEKKNAGLIFCNPH